MTLFALSLRIRMLCYGGLKLKLFVAVRRFSIHAIVNAGNLKAFANAI